MPRRSPWTCVLWDVDGTIVDASDGILRRLTIALEHFGKSPPTRAELVHWIGPPMYDSFQANVGMTPAEATEAVAFYRTLGKADGYTTGREAVPRRRRADRRRRGAAGIPQATASSKPEIQVDALMDHFDLSPYLTADRRCHARREDAQRQVRHRRRGAAPARRRRASTRAGRCSIGDRHHDVEGGADARRARDLRALGLQLAARVGRARRRPSTTSTSSARSCWSRTPMPEIVATLLGVARAGARRVRRRGDRHRRHRVGGPARPAIAAGPRRGATPTRDGAGVALVRLDDAVDELDLEVGLSGALYGGGDAPDLAAAGAADRAARARRRVRRLPRDRGDRRVAGRRPRVVAAHRAASRPRRSRPSPRPAPSTRAWMRANVSAAQQVEAARGSARGAARVDGRSRRARRRTLGALRRGGVGGCRARGAQPPSPRPTRPSACSHGRPPQPPTRRAARSPNSRRRSGRCALRRGRRAQPRRDASPRDCRPRRPLPGEFEAARAALRQARRHARAPRRPPTPQRLGERAARDRRRARRARDGCRAPADPHGRPHRAPARPARPRARRRAHRAAAPARRAHGPPRYARRRARRDRAGRGIRRPRPSGRRRAGAARSRRSASSPTRARHRDPVAALDAARRAMRDAEDAKALADYARRMTDRQPTAASYREPMTAPAQHRAVRSSLAARASRRRSRSSRSSWPWASCGGACGSPFAENPLFDVVAYGLPALREGRWWTPITGTFFVDQPVGLPLRDRELRRHGVSSSSGAARASRSAYFVDRPAVRDLRERRCSCSLAALLPWPWAQAEAAVLDVGPSGGTMACIAAAIGLLVSAVARAGMARAARLRRSSRSSSGVRSPTSSTPSRCSSSCSSTGRCASSARRSASSASSPSSRSSCSRAVEILTLLVPTNGAVRSHRRRSADRSIDVAIDVVVIAAASRTACGAGDAGRGSGRSCSRPQRR